ncbi:MAG: hypothetical protein JNK64_25760 [Myxococcales bacterium]|nr:hypothetical protein [Myxococcales bacterium]
MHTKYRDTRRHIQPAAVDRHRGVASADGCPHAGGVSEIIAGERAFALQWRRP